MKTFDLSRSICLIFAYDAEPGCAFQLSKESTDKLGELPKLLRALAKCYGSNIGDPIMCGGDIHLQISKEPELFNFGDTMIEDIVLSAKEVIDNSLRQPPRPLSQAVTNPHCIDLLRAFSRAYEKTKLVAQIHVAGKVVELPRVQLAAFTEPEPITNSQRYLRAEARGVCIPTVEANVVLLKDMTMLELPHVYYPFDIDEIYARVVKCTTFFIGPVEVAKKDVYRALPGGNLEAQQRL